MSMIIDILQKNKEVVKASIFGSRAMGNYKAGSDVDVVVYGMFITSEIVNQISIELNEKSPLPYYFDIVHYETLSHESLKKHIDEYGKILYKKRQLEME
ncbi:MAG: nucleotidyltransferase domain-containing protein [Alkaliphilus sp.]